MDAFDIKLEKKNAMLKHHQLYNTANLLRFVEVFVLLVVIFRFTTTHLPVAVKNSGEYFRGLSVTLVSPRFVFVVGNIIIITLFVKAGKFSSHDLTTTDLYEKFVEKSHATHPYVTEKKSVVVADEKRIVRLDVHGPKNLRRTQSENMKKTKSDKHCSQLRRLGSEKYVKCCGSEEKSTTRSCAEDGMSNEQFRNTVEAFIARQKKLLREEEYSVTWKDLE
ncbi:uncharacterized protein LOC105795324 [Gossypium raimondii]|uniref:DUF4408 domain-containing protein n=1 Tax=Gossypium raimondii TaxID=29730 RepID=A0A0D2SMZ3_GOSRA|nr:uncharacterized protein LOC105795324 [Gossypium raimondii]KJB32525.1 hypothetical protein B456_005G245100 [Gossypium raimondii]